MNHEEISTAKEQWQETVSQDLPPETTWAIWSRSFSYEVFSDAIRQTARKRENAELYGYSMPLESLARYCSSCARHQRDYERMMAAQDTAVSHGN